MTTKISLKSYQKTLIGFTIFCLLFLWVRNGIQLNHKYNFLVWNIFLGFVPYVFALVTKLFLSKLNKIVVIGLAFLWFLFYPNAPYMITDFIHVQANSSIAVYEALLIFSFAMLSLFYGFYSLKLIEKSLLSHVGKTTVNTVIVLAILLSSFGLYLGRVLRLNSWDVFSNFFETMKTILDHLFPVTKNPVTYLMIILFSLIQYFLLNLIQNIDNE